MSHLLISFNFTVGKYFKVHFKMLFEIIFANFSVKTKHFRPHMSNSPMILPTSQDMARIYLWQKCPRTSQLIVAANTIDP